MKTSKSVTILFAGYFNYFFYEEVVCRSLELLGYRVIRFNISTYFDDYPFSSRFSQFPLPTPGIVSINKNIIKEAELHEPSILIAWRVLHFFPSTIEKIKSLGVETISYNNDDPFRTAEKFLARLKDKLLWSLYLSCLPKFNQNYFYRLVNVKESHKYGAKHCDILLPYFIPEINRPQKLSKIEKSKFEVDVAFIGHFEPDGREKYISALLDHGFNVRVYGGLEWSREVLGDYYDMLAPINNVVGDDYSKAISGAKIALAFLSKLNRDTYTRRCFEIPACKTVMLSERTDNLLKMFEEDKEACYFVNETECVSKVKFLMDNEDKRKEIAEAGYRKVYRAGHDVHSRVSRWIEKILKVKNE